MGIKCRIIRNPQTGKIENVEAPNGEQSQLYLDALAMTQNEEEALDLWATSYIDEFKEIYGNSENPLMLQDSVATPRFQIISEKGAQKVKEYKNLLDKAKELEKNNVPLSDITDQTGWFKYKGSWRFFSNEALEQFKINENAIKQGTEQKLSDILSTDNILFDMYPTLGAVKIVVSQDNSLPKNASYNEGGKVIKTNLFEGRELEAAIAHEVAHFIQQREGLPQGGNYEFLLQQLVSELNFIPKNTPLSLNQLKNLLNKNRTSDNKSTVDAVLSLVDNNTDEAKYKVYRAIMGEMDAHMVTKAYTNRETPYTYLELLDEELIEQRIADTDVIIINSQGGVSFTPKSSNTLTEATQQIIDQLQKTGLAENVYQLSSQEIENKLEELGISEELRKQVVAYHGSPYKFDRFTTEKMGTGEGAQAFGWGLYFTDLEDIARNYADNENLIERHLNKVYDFNIPDRFYQIPSSVRNSKSKLIPYINEQIKGFEEAGVQTQVRDWTKLKNAVEDFDVNVYKVTLQKGKAPSEYTWLEWDKSVNDNFNKKITEQARKEGILTERDDKSDVISKVQTGAHFITNEGDGAIVYDSLTKAFGSPKEASLFLLRAGIDGIKYPAESISRRAASDTARGFNYVVFDENAITIEEQLQFQNQLEKNGIKVIPNGFVINNEVYLNKDTMNDTTPIHEFNHLYNSWLKQNRPEVYKKGLDLVEAELSKTDSEIQDVINYVKSSQPNLEGEALSEEILTELVGNRGLKKITEQKQSGIIEWLKEAWQAIKDMLGISQMSTEQILNLDLQSYADAMAVDLLSGENFIGEQGEANFNRWKGENKLVEGSEVQDVKTGQPIVVKAYHGTTNEFYEFDSSVKGNIEGYLGKVNYFTTDFQDASTNYQADGADITGRIDRRQDELEDTLRYDYQSGVEGLNFQEIIDDFNITDEEVDKLYPKGKPDFIQAEEISRFIAEKELKGGTEKVLELFVKLNNPVVLGNNSSWFETLNVSEQDINEAAEEIAEENDVSIEDAKEDYYFDIQQRAVENTGYENLHVDALTQALEDNGYEGNMASEILGDNFYESEVDLNELEKSLREAELYDNFEGELAQSQVISDFFKNLGFDGIILTDVNQRFRNMNIGVGSSHIHIFDEFNNQIKLADGSNITFGQSADIRYQTKPSPFTDENGEAKIENILEFLKEQSQPQEVEPLTAQEKITVANILRTKQISSQELSSELNRIFADSKFNKEVLNNSSIFSRAEAIAIQQSEEYIKNLRELSEKEIDVEDTVDYPQEFLVLDGTMNKYGLYNTQNPLTVEETVKEQVADTENYEEFANKFNQLDYPDLVNRFNEDPEFAFTMYSKYAQLKKMPSLDSELQPNQTPNRATEVENSLDIAKMDTTDISLLSDVPAAVWNESETQITKALDDIAKKAEVAGLDLSDLSDAYYTKTQEEIENFLDSIVILKEDVTEETLDTFLESYRDFFNIEAQDAQVVEEVGVNHRDKALEKIDDRGLSEYTLFEEEGLLKVAEQTYQRVEKVSLENLYEMVYAEAVINDNRVMPNTAYFNSPRPNNQKLQDPQSKEEILNNMRIFVENNVSLLNLDTDVYDSSVAQQMLLYKYFFEAPINVETTTQVEEAIQEIENFDGDSFYLSSAFHTDFQANKLREKRTNSEDYQNFYKHFTVDQNGLKLIEDNRITIQQLKENIPENIKEDFKNYGAVSRNPSIKRIVKDTDNKMYFNSLAAQRNFYQNNVEALTPFRGDYQNIGEGRVATTEYSKPFLRIGNKLYEKSTTKSGTSFYGQIRKNNSNFNLIQEQGIINKFGEQEIKSYIRNQENVERNSNFYTKEELEEINQKHFNCGL